MGALVLLSIFDSRFIPVPKKLKYNQDLANSFTSLYISPIHSQLLLNMPFVYFFSDQK